VALTFGDHTMDIEFKNFSSLMFLFRQILVKAIQLCQKKLRISCYCLTNKNNKTKITSRLQLFFSDLQYANSVDKKYYEKKNGGGFIKKCWSRACM
jgi:hypothetical protein